MQRVSRLFAELDFPEKLDEDEVRARAAWKRAAGEKVAKYTRVIGLVRGSLVVEVSDKVWQQQLTPLRHFLVSNLARELGAGVVSDIDFRPLPKKRPPQRAMTTGVGTAQRKGVMRVEGIEDPVLGLLYQRSYKMSGGSGR